MTKEFYEKCLTYFIDDNKTALRSAILQETQLKEYGNIDAESRFDILAKYANEEMIKSFVDYFQHSSQLMYLRDSLNQIEGQGVDGSKAAKLNIVCDAIEAGSAMASCMFQRSLNFSPPRTAKIESPTAGQLYSDLGSYVSSSDDEEIKPPTPLQR